MKNYKTVSGESKFITVVQKSKFICRIAPVDGETAAKTYLNGIIKEEAGATHNCYAYILEGDTTFKFSDDGEPHGTAGQPILDALKSENLKNVIAVVTRYFGGVKLGTGGLSRAYFNSVKNCLAIAKKADKKYSAIYLAEFDYNTYSKLNSLFSSDGVKVVKTDFDNGVKVEFAVTVENEASFISKINSLTPVGVSIQKITSKYMYF